MNIQEHLNDIDAQLSLSSGNCKNLFIDVVIDCRIDMTYECRNTQHLSGIMNILGSLEECNYLSIKRFYSVDEKDFTRLEKLSSVNPLSSQCKKHTGDSWNALDWRNWFDKEKCQGNGFIEHISTGSAYYVPSAPIARLIEYIDEIESKKYRKT